LYERAKKTKTDIWIYQQFLADKAQHEAEMKEKDKLANSIFDDIGKKMFDKELEIAELKKKLEELKKEKHDALLDANANL